MVLFLIMNYHLNKMSIFQQSMILYLNRTYDLSMELKKEVSSTNNNKIDEYT